MSRLRQLYIMWLPLLLGIAVLANFAILNWVPRSGQPLRTHKEASLAHLVEAEGTSLSHRYSFYFDVGAEIDGGVLVVSDDSPVSPDWLRSLSDLTVEVVDEPFDIDGSEITQASQPTGELAIDGRIVSYWILEGNGDRWWLDSTDQGLIVVPSSSASAPTTP